jgi:hypothetical protein
VSAHQKVAYACLRSFDEINIASGFVCSCRLLFDLSESWSQLFLLEAINGYYRIRWIGQSSIGNRCSVSSPDPLVGCIDKPNQMLLTASLFNFGSSLVVQPIVKPSTRFFNNRKEAKYRSLFEIHLLWYRGPLPPGENPDEFRPSRRLRRVFAAKLSKAVSFMNARLSVDSLRLIAPNGVANPTGV